MVKKDIGIAKYIAVDTNGDPWIVNTRYTLMKWNSKDKKVETRPGSFLDIAVSRNN